MACDQRVHIGAVRVWIDELAAGLPRPAWQRASTGHGSRGRDYDWAWITVNSDQRWDTTDRWLLVRRHPRTGELAYHLCWAPAPVPLNCMVVASAKVVCDRPGDGRVEV